MEKVKSQPTHLLVLFSINSPYPAQDSTARTRARCSSFSFVLSLSPWSFLSWSCFLGPCCLVLSCQALLLASEYFNYSPIRFSFANSSSRRYCISLWPFGSVIVIYSLLDSLRPFVKSISLGLVRKKIALRSFGDFRYIPLLLLYQLLLRSFSNWNLPSSERRS